MKHTLTKEVKEANVSEEILADVTLTFEENLTGENMGNCNDYGCTCISYEKCCGCFLQ